MDFVVRIETYVDAAGRHFRGAVYSLDEKRKPQDFAVGQFHLVRDRAIAYAVNAVETAAESSDNIVVGPQRLRATRGHVEVTLRNQQDVTVPRPEAPPTP